MLRDESSKLSPRLNEPAFDKAIQGPLHSDPTGSKLPLQLGARWKPSTGGKGTANDLAAKGSFNFLAFTVLHPNLAAQGLFQPRSC
jgi:hypothetical protein